MENDVFLASKELLEILSLPSIEQVDALSGASIIVNQDEKKCTIKKVKINDYSIEILASLPQSDCIEILRTGIGKSFTVPLIFGDSFNSEICEIELYDNYNVKIMSRIVHS